MKIGYARVSRDDQRLDLQRDALTAAGCEKLFSDKASGTKAARPGLSEALAFARPGDVLVVWRLDRLVWDANKVSSLEIKFHSEQSGSGLVRPLEPPMIAACKAAIREEISKVTIEINDLRFQVRMTLYSHGSGVFRPFEGRCEALG